MRTRIALTLALLAPAVVTAQVAGKAPARQQAPTQHQTPTHAARPAAAPTHDSTHAMAMHPVKKATSHASASRASASHARRSRRHRSTMKPGANAGTKAKPDSTHAAAPARP